MPKTIEIPSDHPYYKEFCEFSELLTSSCYSDGTYHDYMTYIDDFLSWLVTNDKKGTLAELPWSDLRAYQNYLRESMHLKGSTINQRFCAIKLMMGGIVERTWNDKAVRNLKYETFVGTVPTEAEVVKILSSAPSRRVMLEMALLAFCGPRVSELVRLHWEDIRRERGTLHILPGKNHQDREVPIPTDIFKELEIYCRKLYPKQVKTDFIFGGRCEDGSTSIATIENHLNEITDRLGWKDRGYTCHSLRRYFGCEYYLAHPDDLVSLASIMGHKTVSSTLVYIRPAAAHKARIADNDRINTVFRKAVPQWK
ncbi:MAG: site-specific integrase [Clostridia bacterium]|nr:site-specific integrase [Clostridia bacterium]